MPPAIHCKLTAPACRTEWPRGRAPLPQGWQAPRRMSAMCRAVLECAAESLQAAGLGPEETDTLPVVFASRYSEFHRTMELLKEWKEYGDLSPAGFSLSVHNAPASVLSLAMKGHGSFSTVAAGEDTLRMGVLEAAMFAQTHGRCLFLYADPVSPGEEACHACSALLTASTEEMELPRGIEYFIELCRKNRP